MRPPDDLAQVALRALLAGPALGLAAGLLLAGHLRRLGAVLTFALGAGFGVALALVVLDLATAPARRRAPWVAAALGLALVPLLTPLPLLGGEFALALRDTGSSRTATVELLARHQQDPLELLDPDVALGAALALSGLVVGRARGWRAVTQAAVSAWAVHLGLGGRFLAGHVAHPPLALVLALALGLAVFAPFAVELADRAVRALRLRQPGRLLPLVALLLAPSLVAAAWAVATLTEQRWPVTVLASPEPTGAALALAVQALLQRPRGPLPAGKALLLGGLLGSWAMVASHDVPGWDQAGSLVLVGGLAAVLADPVTLAGAGAPPPRRGWARPWRAWGALLLALLLGLAEGGALRPLHLGGGASGLEARVALGLRLGADPVALRAWTYDAGGVRARQGQGWDRAVPLPSGSLTVELDHALLVGAAEAGEGEAARILGRRGVRYGSGPGADALRWLRAGAAAGDLECARDLVLDPAAPPSDAEAGATALLGLARAAVRPPPRLIEALACVWSRLPGRRAELEALLVAAPDRWLALAEAALTSDALPSAATRAALGEHLRRVQAGRPLEHREDVVRAWLEAPGVFQGGAAR